MAQTILEGVLRKTGHSIWIDTPKFKAKTLFGKDIELGGPINVTRMLQTHEGKKVKLIIEADV